MQPMTPQQTNPYVNMTEDTQKTIQHLLGHCDASLARNRKNLDQMKGALVFSLVGLAAQFLSMIVDAPALWPAGFALTLGAMLYNWIFLSPKTNKESGYVKGLLSAIDHLQGIVETSPSDNEYKPKAPDDRNVAI